MARLKVFTSANGDVSALEAEINDWLEAAQPHITAFAQSVLGKGLVLSFLYEANVELATAELAVAAEVPEIFEQSLEQDNLDPTADTLLLPEAELPY